MGTADDRVARFIDDVEGEDEKLAKSLKRLNDEANEHLDDVVARFDRKRSGSLDDDDRALAIRVLGLLHRPSPKGLELLSTILGYMACDKTSDKSSDKASDKASENESHLDHQEVTIATEVLELFCKADSENDTLSNKELEVLEAVLAHLDTDGNGVIDAKERAALRDELWDAPAFLAKQKAENPLVREVLGLK